jgi:hypothetical protein
MGLNKDKLVYDSSDVANSDSVAAFLRTGAGALTSTNVGGKEALDVNMVNEIDIRDLAYTQDSVTSHQGGSWTVAATQSGSWTVAATQSGTWTVEQGGTWTVTATATDLDIRDLVAASDSVSAYTKDGSGNAINSTSNALNTYITNSALNVKDAAEAISHARVQVTTTSGLLIAALSNRRRMVVQNLGNKPVYVGASGVTSSGATQGIKINVGASFEFPLGAGAALHAVSESGTQDVIAFQAA